MVSIVSVVHMYVDGTLWFYFLKNLYIIYRQANASVFVTSLLASLVCWVDFEPLWYFAHIKGLLSIKQAHVSNKNNQIINIIISCHIDDSFRYTYATWTITFYTDISEFFLFK